MSSNLPQAEQEPEILGAGWGEIARDEHVALKENLALHVGHEGDRCRSADSVDPAGSIVPDSNDLYVGNDYRVSITRTCG